jgi:serine/threonine-protein kinase
MAIGDDNPPPRELPELPAVTGLGGVASAPKPSTERTSKPADAIHRDSDAPSDQQPLDGAAADAAGKPATGAVADPFIGKTFGNFQLVEKIGQGGMGVVYKGRQVSLDRVVAVKILSKALYDNQEFIKRFEREAKAVARINHPNIVAVYEFGQHEGLYYMVTEFVDGSSLSRLIAEKIMLDAKELAPLMIGCLAGLAHVGQTGIVHRDIKPDNILITREGIAKIADFGLAKDVSGTNDHTDLTAAGLAMGTPAYMSPEQCMGRRLDVRSDIYALGVTAYYALAGEKPFVGHSSFEIMTKQREYMPPPPIQLNPRVPKECSELVMRMLAKNPKDRFEGAEQCRQTWIDMLARVQSTRAAMRTGEFEVPTQQPKSSRMAVPLPPPPAGQSPSSSPMPQLSPPSIAPPGPSGIAPAQGSPQPSELPPLAPPPGSSSTGSHRRAQTDSSSGDPAASGTENHSRPITERRLRQMSDAVTCPKCGMLNRAELASCSKCGYALKEQDPNQVARQQEAEAQRLLDQKRYGDAAVILARLADKEVDRRQRSILRSKEREVRKLDIEHQVADVLSRAKTMTERGDLRAAIEALEQASGKISGEATASTSGAEMTIGRELAVLRARVRLRKRARMIIAVVLVLGGLGGAGFAFRKQIQEIIKPAHTSMIDQRSAPAEV